MKPYTLNADEASTVSYSSGVDANGNAVADHGFAPSGDQPHKWGASSYAGTPGGTVTFNYGGAWTAAQRAQIAAGLALWSDIANIQFAPVADIATAQLTFLDDTNPPSSNDGAFTIDGEQGTAQYGLPTLARITDSGVSIQTTIYGWTDVGSFVADRGYGIDTVVHEEGHVLGLAHTGNYNAVAGQAAVYNQRNPFDSRQWSIMSYLDPYDPTSKYYDKSGVTGTDWGGGTPQTWMPLDILAAQRLYGVATTTPLSGGQVFGFHCNVQGASEDYFDFTKDTRPIVTLWDAGGGNTLDLSGFAGNSVVDLRPGTFSSAGGLTNNIGIGFGVAIDTAISGLGSAANQFTVNADSDHIVGNGADDMVTFAAAGGRWNETGSGVNRVWSGPAISDRLDNIRNVAFTGGADTVATSGAVEAVTVYGVGNQLFLGSGSASVVASGGDTIVGVTGHDYVQSGHQGSGPGNLLFSNQGAVLTYVGGDNADTIVASYAAMYGGSGGLLAFGGGTGSSLNLVSTQGSATVVGDVGGSVTVHAQFGGVFVGGSGGSNYIDIGVDYGVAFAGGDRDTLVSGTIAVGYLVGSTGAELLDADKGGGGSQQILYAGSGNDTLLGGAGTNFMVVGSGAATATGGAGVTVYDAQSGHAGGSLTITDWHAATDYLGLYGYGAGADQAAVASEQSDGAGGTVITLADHTRITFVGVAGLDTAHVV